MSIDSTWLTARIDKTKLLIVAYEDALTELSSGGVQSYQLDTGQTRQIVTRAQLGSLQNTLDSLENRLATLCARRDGAGHYARPGW